MWGDPCSPSIWVPLSLLTSCLFLSSCRLTGARSYWCHCHRLPPGYVCACGLGCHHTEKVLGLLNSIKHFSVTQPACLQPSTAPELSAWGPGRNGAKDMGKALQALCWAAMHRVLIALNACGISWVAQIWQGLSAPLRSNLWQSVALSRELKRIFLGLVWVIVTVLGLTLHSFPREGLFMGVSLPKFICNLILTHCIWASCTRGDWGGDKWSVWGRKETHRCFGAGLLSYILSHGKTRQQEVPLSLLRQPGKGWGLQPVLVGPRPGPVQHWRSLRWRRAGLGLRK